MTWITEYINETKKATDEQLGLWLKYFDMFRDDENEVTVDSRKRKKYREIILTEISKRKNESRA